MRRDPEERFLAKVAVDENSGCWLWSGWITEKGYPMFFDGERDVRAHRWAYEHWVGPIPVDLQVDHVRARGCTHRHCVNPAHLEAVTCRENLMRGDTLPAANAAKTHCSRGHPYDEENTHIRPSGRRSCRACDRERQRELRAS